MVGVFPSLVTSLVTRHCRSDSKSKILLGVLAWHWEALWKVVWHARRGRSTAIRLPICAFAISDRLINCNQQATESADEMSANLKEEIVGRGTSGQLAKTVMDFKQRNVDTVTFKGCFSSKRMVNMVFVTFVRLCCTPVWAWWNQKARFDWRVD